MIQSRRSSRLVLSGLLLLSGLSFAAAGAAIPAHAQVSAVLSVSADHVPIYHLVGDIYVEPNVGERVRVQAWGAGPDGRPVTIRAGRMGDRQAITVHNRADRIGYPGVEERTIRVREDGTFGNVEVGDGRPVTISGMGDGEHAWAGVRVQVPEGKRVEIHTLAGWLRLAGADAEIDVYGRTTPVIVENVRGILLEVPPTPPGKAP